MPRASWLMLILFTLFFRVVESDRLHQSRAYQHSGEALQEFALIRNLLQSSHNDEAVVLYHQYRERVIFPERALDIRKYSDLIKLFGRAEQIETAARLFDDLKNGVFPHDMSTLAYNTMITVYGENDRLKDLWTIFQELLKSRSLVPDLFTFQAVFRFLIKHDEYQRLADALDTLNKHYFDFEIEPRIWTPLLKKLKQLETIEAITLLVYKLRPQLKFLGHDLITGTTYISLCSRLKDTELAFEAFNAMREKSIVTYNTMFRACTSVQVGFILKEMKDKEVFFNEVTLKIIEERFPIVELPKRHKDMVELLSKDIADKAQAGAADGGTFSLLSIPCQFFFMFD